MESIIRIQKNAVKVPSLAAEIKAKSNRTAVSVIIVPPMVIVTASLRVIPSLLTIGYEIRVWVENILAMSSEASRL